MYHVIVLSHFRKQLKPLVKKYPALKEAVIETLENFSEHTAVHIGHHVYKVRLSPKGFSKGKSKSFRLIVLLVHQENYLVPVAMYSKSTTATISAKELAKHLERILFELTQR